MNRPRIAQRAFVVAAFVLACAHAARAGLTLGPRVSFDHGYTYENGSSVHGRVVLASEPGGFLLASGESSLRAYHLSEAGEILDRNAHYFNPGWGQDWMYDISDLDGVSWKIVGGRRSDPLHPERTSNLSLFNAESEALAKIGSEVQIVPSGRLSYPTIHWTGKDHLIAWLEDDDANGRSTLWTIRVATDGTLQSTTRLPICDDSAVGVFGLDANESGGCVAWIDWTGEIRLRRIDARGDLEGSPISLGFSTGAYVPSVGATLVGDQVLVVWSEWGNLRGAVVRPDDSVLDAGTSLDGLGSFAFTLAAQDSTVAISARRGSEYEGYRPETILVRVDHTGAVQQMAPPVDLDPDRDPYRDPTADGWNARLDMDCTWAGARLALAWDFQPPILVARSASGQAPSKAMDCQAPPEEPALVQLLDRSGSPTFSSPLRVNPGWGIGAALAFWNGGRFVVDLEDSFDPGWLHATSCNRDGDQSGDFDRFGGPGPRSGPCEHYFVGARSLRTRGLTNLAIHEQSYYNEMGCCENSQGIVVERLTASGEPLRRYGDTADTYERRFTSWDAAGDEDTILLVHVSELHTAQTVLEGTYFGAHSSTVSVLSQAAPSAPTTIAFENRFLLIWIEAREDGTRLYKALLDPLDPNQRQVEGQPVVPSATDVSAPNFVAGPDGEALLLYNQARTNDSVEIRGIRWSREGEQRDRLGISITTSAALNVRPHGVWDGKAYVVLWNESSAEDPRLIRTLWLRVDRDGRLIDPEPIPLPRPFGNVTSLASDEAGTLAIGVDGKVQMLYDDLVTPVALSPVGISVDPEGVRVDWTGRSIDETATLLRAPAHEGESPPSPPLEYQPVAGLQPMNGIGPHRLLDRSARGGECYAYTIGVGLDGPAPLYAEPRLLCLSTLRVVRIEVCPNPSRSSVVVRCGGLRTGDDVRLEVIDAGGRVQRRMESQASEQGIAEFLWERRDAEGHEVAAGIYWLRIDGGQKTQTTPLVLLK
ncbi:MAG: hypothetical protein U0527_07035 [Candidatus Eisenbacteria bacterium]